MSVVLKSYALYPRYFTFIHQRKDLTALLIYYQRTADVYAFMRNLNVKKCIKRNIIRRNIVLDRRFFTSRFIIFMKFLLICYSSYIQDHTITTLVNKNNTLFTRILNIPESHFLLKIIYYFEETFSKSVYIFYYIHIGWQNIQNLL